MSDFYIEATLIVEGALEETKLLDSEDELDTWVSELRTEHTTVNAETQWEVFTIKHDHAPDLECECVQYLQDHKPSYIIG